VRWPRSGRGAVRALLLAASAAACAPATATGPQPPPIILVSIDTLRADRLGAWGNPGGLTPSLDRFAAEAVVFERTYSQAGETLFSHASLFTSRYPSELGRLAYDFVAPEGDPTLAEVLGHYGYQSAAFVSGGHLAPGLGLERGFDLWRSLVDWGSLHETGPAALAWLDRRLETDPARAEQPFLLFVHGYDPHHRYLKPPPFGYLYTDADYRGVGEEAAARLNGTAMIFDGWLHTPQRVAELLDFREPRLFGAPMKARLAEAVAGGEPGSKQLTARDVQHIRRIYDGAVSYADAWFGLFMAGLQRRGLLDEAVVVVLSDHGESLGERGLFNHRYSLSDEDLHVPLMVRLPGGEGGGRRVGEVVELTDLMPTLLEIAGAAPPAEIRGISLGGALAGGAHPRRAAFSEGAFRQVSARSLEARLTYEGVGADSPWLTGLLEVAPLDGAGFTAEGAPEDAEALRSAMVVWQRSLVRGEGGGVVDPALRERLRERGYWGLE